MAVPIAARMSAATLANGVGVFVALTAAGAWILAICLGQTAQAEAARQALLWVFLALFGGDTVRPLLRSWFQGSLPLPAGKTLPSDVHSIAPSAAPRDEDRSGGES